MGGQPCSCALWKHCIVYLELGESGRNAESFTMVSHHVFIRGKNSLCSVEVGDLECGFSGAAYFFILRLDWRLARGILNT